MSSVDGWGISCQISLKWLPQDSTVDKSTLVQVMAWCLQAPSHYLKQCWPRSLLPYGFNRPQWVNCCLFSTKPLPATKKSGKSPSRLSVLQSITWTNADLLSIGPQGTNFREIWMKIQEFSFNKCIDLEILYEKYRPLCPGLNLLKGIGVHWSIKIYPDILNKFMFPEKEHFLQLHSKSNS